MPERKRPVKDKFVNTGKKYDIETIRAELESIDYAVNSNKNLQTWQGDFDVFDPANKEKTDQVTFQEEDITEPYYDIPYINSIIKENGWYRTRVLMLDPRECYTYHTDPTPRMHIPVKTNEACMFILDDEVVKMDEEGTVYWIDTTFPHLALNGSREKRIHIVGCV